MFAMKTKDEIIDALGGTLAVSKICGITTGAVSQWRSSPNGIPKPWLKFFMERNPEIFKDGNIYLKKS